MYRLSYPHGYAPTTGYGLVSEVSAYRAQFAYSGIFQYRKADYFKNNPLFTNAFFDLGAAVIPITTINSIVLINNDIVRNIGEEGMTSNGLRTWLPLYRRLK